MTRCFLASDLHGDVRRWRALLEAARRDRPAAILLAGDLLPHGEYRRGPGGPFASSFLFPELESLRADLGEAYPRLLAIPGNDDAAIAWRGLVEADERGLLSDIHQRSVDLAGFAVCGYACVPPTPFLLKDWERYDVSRYVDPGCVSPEEGFRTVPVPATESRYGTIARDLATLLDGKAPDRTVLLLHAPPYDTALDRAALDGRTIDGVPVDVHVGSIAVRRAIEEHQPWLSLHGHVHEAPRLTGSWRSHLGRTPILSGAHDGPELALVRLTLEDPSDAARELIAP